MGYVQASELEAGGFTNKYITFSLQLQCGGWLPLHAQQPQLHVGKLPLVPDQFQVLLLALEDLGNVLSAHVGACLHVHLLLHELMVVRHCV